MIEILTDRLIIRELNEADVTDRYLSWMSDNVVKKNITFAEKSRSFIDLKKYVRARIGREDVLFLGIFWKETSLHIGNIKYEPVNSSLGYAIMGILIGDSKYRGIGATEEVIKASAHWLYNYRNVRQIVLGVHINNLAAIRVYEKVGFVKEPTDFVPNVLPGSITMVWNLGEQLALVER